MLLANLAVALAQLSPGGQRLRVGLLDLDIFGPSVPKLMGLEGLPPPELTKGVYGSRRRLGVKLTMCVAGAIVPFANHGLQCMSIGFLIPSGGGGSSTSADTAVVWRGLMVQKAAQQLLFDVDWRGRDAEGPGLDVLVVDMPPGTGDVQLTLGQLVKVDGTPKWYIAVFDYAEERRCRGYHRFDSTRCRPYRC